jgi:hypothetical protein
LLAAIAGFLLVFVLTKHSGLGISPDSIYYTSVSNSLLQGHGFYQFDNTPFVLFPLFYPSFLAFVQFITRQHITVVATFMNGFLFGIAIFMSGIILEKLNTTKWLKWILLIAIASSPSLLEIYTMLWSEALFIVEILLFIWFCFTYFKSYSNKDLIWVAIIAAIAFETRLAGVTIVLTGGFLILASRELAIAKKIKHFLIFGFIACSFISINLIRNYLVASSLTGVRQKGETPFAENVKYYGAVLSDWLPFSNATKNFPFLLGAIFLISISGIFIYRYYKKIEHNSLEKIAASFTLVYSLFMLLSATFSKYETINNRLLAPFFIPCLFTLSFYMVSWMKLINTKWLRRSFIIILLMQGGLILKQYYNTNLDTYYENIQGGIGGYSDDDWVFSDAMNYLKTDRSIFKTGIPVYSNASHAVYFFTGEHLNLLPETAHVKDMERFEHSPQLILIWFNNEDNPAIPTLEKVKQNKNLTLVKAFKDGFIFQSSLK